MKVRFLVSLVVTIGLLYSLNRNWSSIPPLGKFLDPFNGFWQNAESRMEENLDFQLTGLKDEVTIYYDSLQIPHIYANNEADLFFTQGFVTARHRLWQMEFQTHVAAGRISEIIGEVAMDFDRYNRRIGMVFAAENSLEVIEKDPTAKMIVDNYTNGVNSYIQSLNPKDLPIEYKLLNYEPEPWTNLKSALLLKYMSKTLNIGDKDMEMTNALHVFGKELVDLLYPDHENVGDPIVHKPDGWNFDPIRIDSVPFALPIELVAIHSPEKPSKDVGSNNWAISGAKTATGYPLLSNDPHLTLSLPSIWYIMHLNSPTINTMGATLPGAPSVISGFNDSTAWGETNAQRDLVDWFRIRFEDDTRSSYLHDGDYLPSRKVIEEIKIKGKSSFYDTVIYSHHGPIVYDKNYHGEDEKNHYAFRWSSHDPSEEVLTFYKLNKSKNHQDYMNALDHFGSPGQNFAFASVQGDIAMRIQGKFPVRRKDEGKFVLDGSKSIHEWQAFIPNDQMIQDKNPERGFISSANQYPADATYPYYITATSYEAYRNRRINSRLSEMTNITPKDLMDLQFDTYNLKAAESLPMFLDALDIAKLSSSEKEAYDILKSWDYNNTIDSKGASYYEAWWDSLFPMIWDEMRESKADMRFPTTYNTIKLMKEKPDLSFYDIQSTADIETLQDLLQLSFSKAVVSIEEWKTKSGKDPRWADFKDTFIGHLLQGLPAFSQRVQHGGNHDIVNASTRTHGPSWRMIVSLEPAGVKAWGVYPGGQSGNPGSPFYNNMIGTWAKGENNSLLFSNSKEEVKSNALYSIQLQPLSK